MKLSRLIWTTAATVLLSAACTKNHNQGAITINGNGGDPAFIAVTTAVPQTNTIQFLNEAGQPLVGAKILIGYDINDPFNGNEFVTDTSGLVNIPNDWKAALPVTVVSSGNVRTTYDNVAPTTTTLQVSMAEGQENLEVKGNTTEFGNLPRDGMVDFGLVIPGFTQKKLLHFDISAVISPSVDTIRVAGQKLEIPSNLTLPSQTESYIIPIKLNKPRYRTYVRQEGQYKFFAMHGKFPFKKVIDDVRGGKSVFEVVNHFEFVGGGMTEVGVNKSGGRADMAVNLMGFNSSIPVKAPQYAADKSLLSLALAEVDGMLVPTDLKRLLPNQSLNLKTTTAAHSAHILHILTNSQNLAGVAPRMAVMSSDLMSPMDAEAEIAAGDEGIRILASGSLAPGAVFNQLSFVLQGAQNSAAPVFLDMVAPPQIEPNLVKMQAPQLPAGIVPVATYLVLSEVEELASGKVKSERRTRLWEVFTPTWVDAVRLPSFTLNRLPNRKYRWEVMYLGRSADASGAGNSPVAGADLLEGVTHVTRNAADF